MREPISRYKSVVEQHLDKDFYFYYRTAGNYTKTGTENVSLLTSYRVPRVQEYPEVPSASVLLCVEATNRLGAQISSV